MSHSRDRPRLKLSSGVESGEKAPVLQREPARRLFEHRRAATSDFKGEGGGEVCGLFARKIYKMPRYMSVELKI